jgi:micrococcal nuclease
MMTTSLFTYYAELTKVLDGDTVDVVIDLGFNIRLTERVRLFGLNTPEVYGVQKPAGLVSKQFVVDWFVVAAKEGAQITLGVDHYNSRGKFGRILATIIRDHDPVSLNQALITNKMAVVSKGLSYDEMLGVPEDTLK